VYELFQFIGQVAEDGYEWRSGPIRAFGPDVRKYDEPALIELGENSRPYKPGPDLFLKFASVDPEADEEILRFANSYGLLGGGPRWIAPEPKRKSAETTAVTGELRSHWQEHLHRMKAAVTLWEAIQREDSSVLASCIRWRSRDRVTYDWPPSSEMTTPWSTHATIASSGINSHLLERFQHGDILKPARFYLQEVVNKSLAELVSPRLLWKAPDRNEMGLFMVPSTLIGCLWLQLADAIAGFQKFRLCENESCRKPILVAAEGSGYRTNRKTCSNACRIRLYSGRKLEARRLHDKKVSVREIAKRLDTEVEQIQRWIAKS
jgi:hypothetical protein